MVLTDLSLGIESAKQMSSSLVMAKAALEV
jgi:hypothetical protein